jgi:FkbM family methyltransferase
MLNNLKILTKSYGMLKGLRVYCSLKFGKSGALKIPRIKKPVYFRKNTIDEYTIIEIFGLNSYDFSIPYKPRLIIDAGANIGLSAVYFSSKYPQSKIIAIEPEYNNFELLKRNADNYKNIIPLQKAVWNKKTLVEIKDKGYGIRGFTVEETTIKSENATETVTIEELMGEHAYVDILKIDIEGSEKNLFEKNYTKWLPQVKCIVIEFHDFMIPDCKSTVYKAIEEYNFSEFQIGENTVFMNQDLI